MKHERGGGDGATRFDNQFGVENELAHGAEDFVFGDVDEPIYVLTDVLECARAVNAREIEIVGYRGAARLSNGQLMSEDADMGKRRAEQLATLLQGANLKSPSYKVSWQDVSANATGVDDYVMRRAVITVRAK